LATKVTDACRARGERALAAAGDSTVKRPGPELPAATATTMFAASKLVDRDRQQVLDAVRAAAEAEVRDIETSAYAASSASRMSSDRALVTSAGKML
jgi:hypothetical protein